MALTPLPSSIGLGGGQTHDLMPSALQLDLSFGLRVRGNFLSFMGPQSKKRLRTPVLADTQKHLTLNFFIFQNRENS
jgi:hypothetical protein